MPYAPEHRNHTRKRIVRSAQVMFNRRGFDGTSINEIMAHAGLTHGGFYSYFESKTDLYAAAIALSLGPPPIERWPGVTVDFTAADAARQLIGAYLSREHFEDVDASCPMVALPSDASRSDPKVKRVFEEVFKGMVNLFQQSLQPSDEDARERALAMAGICVGGMVIARAIEDRTLADSVRDASKKIALELGGWSSTQMHRSRSRRKARPYDNGDVAARVVGAAARKPRRSS